MAEAKRRLVAILSADVAGYSRLMGDDERATMDTLTAYRQVFRKHISDHDGRVVDTAGDSVLSVFDSVVEAVHCAVDVQGELEERNADKPEDRRMLFRIGVNLGDIFEQDDGTVYGDGVNVAARLESLAEAGGVCISESAHMQVEGKTDFIFHDIGEHAVKNIARPISAYRLGTRGGNGDPPRDEKALVLPDKPSIAVLPFTNLSGDPEQEYFSDGITEDIITELSRFRDLFVIARNTTFTYKGAAVNVEQVGRELGVRYVLEGSVRKSGDRVRITAQLIDADTGGHVWAERYDRVLTDIFEVQDELTRQIAGTLGARLEEAALERSMHKRTDDLAAYDYVLRSLKWWHTTAPEDHARGREFLERAVELDTTYAQARAHLANAYVNEFVFGFNLRPDPIGRATREAKRAVELDPSDSFAHYILSRCFYYGGEHGRFEAEAEMALALNPNDADALADLGNMFSLTYCRLADGAEMSRRAMRLNSRHPPFYHFTIIFELYFTGRYGDTLDEMKRLDVDYWAGYVWLATVLARLGNEAEARAARDRACELKPDFTVAWYLDHRRFHRSFHEPFIVGAAKAGLPLGDIAGLGTDGS